MVICAFLFVWSFSPGIYQFNCISLFMEPTFGFVDSFHSVFVYFINFCSFFFSFTFFGFSFLFFLQLLESLIFSFLNFHYEYAPINIRIQVFTSTYSFLLSIYLLVYISPGSYGNFMFNFLRNCLFSKATAPFHFPTSNVGGLQFLHILTNT